VQGYDALLVPVHYYFINAMDLMWARLKLNVPLPFSFPFFGQNFTTVNISTNGNLYFSTPPTRPSGEADDVPSSTFQLGQFKMISGLWDDLCTGPDTLPGGGPGCVDPNSTDDVYQVNPDPNRTIFRWQAVTFSDGTSSQFPVNFEIELRVDGTIISRYGVNQSAPINTGVFPVVGMSGGEPDPYVITSLTSEITPTSLTNAPTVTYIPRNLINPLENASFFVSQQYRDFLARDPDPAGLFFWTDQIAGNATNTPPPCAVGDTHCLSLRRITVANAFFFEQEYQSTGSYVYRIYRESFGNTQPFPNAENPLLPSYAAFAPDRSLVVGGANLAQSQLDFANAFVQRPAFIARYPLSLSTAGQFVDAVLATIQNDLGVNLSGQRTNLINLYNGTNGGRGAVIYRLADDNVQTNPINNRPLIDGEYNRAFVFTEYAGFLRRDSDLGGFNFWLGQVNSGPLRDGNKQHGMVCSFITSLEYQLRFSALTPRSNAECGP